MGKTIQKQIKELIEKRNKIFKTWDDSYDEKEEKYMTEEPVEIDELEEKIFLKLAENAETLPVDFILESLTHLGESPCVIYDDNGHFAVSSDGFQPLPEEGEELAEGEVFVFVLNKEAWQDTVREALIYYLYFDGNDFDEELFSEGISLN